MSPLAPESPFAAGADSIISVTDDAMTELLTMRDQEPETDRLGLRLEVISEPGAPFQYDLSFDVVTKAAFTDEVRTHAAADGRNLKVIVPAASIDPLTGATLDFTTSQGLVIRNPNKPQLPAIDGLTRDDELSAEVEAVIADEVNPALAAHGGFVTYAGHDGEGTAYLTMGGGCHGCSMSRMTMLDGVQTMVLERVPTIERVKDITDHASGENPYYR